MDFNEIMQALEGYGDERTKATLMKHGAKEPFFGVKVADLKKILKKTKKNHELSLSHRTSHVRTNLKGAITENHRSDCCCCCCR